MPRPLRTVCGISIHALCEEGDHSKELTSARFWNFYPRPLRGGRPASAPVLPATCGISIHALCEEGDIPASGTTPAARPISIHALCEEGDEVDGDDSDLPF